MPMPGKIIGLDLSRTGATGVLVQRGFRGTRVLACATALATDNHQDPSPLARVLGQLGHKGRALCTTALAAEHLSFRNITLPFRAPRKIRQVLPFELETEFPVPSEALLLDFIPVGEENDGLRLQVGAARRNEVEERITALQDSGYEPESIGVRPLALGRWLMKETAAERILLLNLDRERAELVLLVHQQPLCIRSLDLREATDIPAEEKTRGLTASVESTLHAFFTSAGEGKGMGRIYLTGNRARELAGLPDQLTQVLGWPVQFPDMRQSGGLEWSREATAQWQPGVMDQALALAMSGNTGSQGFDFLPPLRTGRWSPATLYREFKVPLFLCLLVLLLGVTDLGLGFTTLQQRYQQLDSRVNELFSATFPEVRRIVDPVQQARQKLVALKQSNQAPTGTGSPPSLLQLLADISTNIPRTTEVKVSRLAMDRDHLLIKGETDTFNSVDTIQKGLAGSSALHQVTIEAANLSRDGGEVEFEIRARIRDRAAP